MEDLRRKDTDVIIARHYVATQLAALLPGLQPGTQEYQQTMCKLERRDCQQLDTIISYLQDWLNWKELLSRDNDEQTLESFFQPLIPLMISGAIRPEVNDDDGYRQYTGRIEVRFGKDFPEDGFVDHYLQSCGFTLVNQMSRRNGSLIQTYCLE